MWQYPKTPVKPATEIQHGQKMVDDYRWLEDGENPEVQTWVKAQNSLQEKVLAGHGFKNFQEESARLFKTPMFGNPYPVNGIYFWQERQPDEDQAVLYVKKGLKGKQRRLVDPNQMKQEGTITLDFWYPSRQGTYIAYGLSEGGDEKSTLYLLEVATGEKLKDVIPYARYASVAWLPDESGFYYSRHPRPGTVPKAEEQYHQKIFFHRLGDDPGHDQLIFGEGRDKLEMHNLSLSLDGSLLAIHSGKDWTQNEISIVETKSNVARPLIMGLKAKFGLGFASDKAFIVTNYRADNSRILWAPIESLPKKIEDWQEFVPESKDILMGFRMTKDKMLVIYQVNACSAVEIYDYQGNRIGEMPLPPLSSLAGISSRREETEFFFGVTDFRNPKVIYRYNPDSGEYEFYRQIENPLDPEKYVVKQEWFKSKDGTKVPMFIIHRKGIKKDGKNPTILYGYGGYGISQTPEFLRVWVPWFKRGGIFAIANIRGGGEFGEKWHREGRMEKKQNTFDDFIAAAEYLIKEKYTSSEHLGILGGSNGGLTVGAAMTQRPDLFRAVGCRVPILDMARFHKLLIAERWKFEWGDPAKAKEFKWLMRWSPFHNVKKNVEYPSVFFTTADKDTRVDPMHARKMTALLQATNKENIVLLRTEMEAGHGPGKPVKKTVESIACIQAYFAWQLGLKI